MKCAYCDKNIDVIGERVEGKVTGLIPRCLVIKGKMIDNKNDELLCYPDCVDKHDEMMGE